LLEFIQFEIKIGAANENSQEKSTDSQDLAQALYALIMVKLPVFSGNSLFNILFNSNSHVNCAPLKVSIVPLSISTL